MARHKRGPYYTDTDSTELRPTNPARDACEALARALRKARQDARLTQADFAKAHGLNRSTLAQWETCTRTIPLSIAQKLAPVMGIEPSRIQGSWMSYRGERVARLID